MRKEKAYAKLAAATALQYAGAMFVVVLIVGLINARDDSYSSNFLISLGTAFAGIAMVVELAPLAVQLGVTRRTQWQVNGVMAGILALGGLLADIVLSQILLARGVRFYSLTASWLPGMGQTPPTTLRLDYILFSFISFYALVLAVQALGIIMRGTRNWLKFAFGLLLATFVPTLTMLSAALMVTYKAEGGAVPMPLLFAGLLILLGLAAIWQRAQVLNFTLEER